MASAYQQTEIMSSSPERLVPLLYQHLIVNLTRGATFMDQGDYDGRFESLSKAQDIISELLSSLDFDAGGELATRLAGLYAFWTKEIMAASRAKDVTRLQQVTRMVATLHEAWEPASRAQAPLTPPLPGGGAA